MKPVRVLCFVVLPPLAGSLMAEVKQPDKEVMYWAGATGDGRTFVLELYTSGVVRLIPETGAISKGTWKRNATRIEMELNRRFLQLSGTIEGDAMTGVAATKRGDKWTWWATKQPLVVQTDAPAYPPLAAAAMVGGAVLVHVEIDPSGEVASIRDVKGHPLLRQASSDAARRYKFVPAVSEGIRTARLVFLFRRLPVGSKDSVAPVVLSPYQIAIRRQAPTVMKSYARRSAKRGP